MSVLAFRFYYWLAGGVGSISRHSQTGCGPALRCHVAAAAKLRVALC